MLVSRPARRAPPGDAAARRRVRRCACCSRWPAPGCCGSERASRAGAISDRARTALAGYEQAAGASAARPGAGRRPAAPGRRCSTARAPCRSAYDAPAAARDRRRSACRRTASSPPASRAVYRHALEYALFPRLVWRVEAQMRGNLTQPDFEYEATRVYLMLGGAGPLDRDLVREWITLDWEQTYPGAPSAALRASLRAPSRRAAGQPAAAGRARRRPGRRRARHLRPGQPGAAHLLAHQAARAAAARLPPWRPSDALGAAGVTRVRPLLRPAADRRHPRLLHARTASTRCCCPSLGRGAAGRRRRKLGTGRKDRARPGQPGHARGRAGRRRRSTPPNTSRPGTPCWPISTWRRCAA